VRTMQMQSVEYARNSSCRTCGTATGQRAAPATIEGVLHLEPRMVAEMLKKQNDLMLLDVREPWEHDVARISNSTFVPMNLLPGKLNSLDRSSEIIVYCHHGVRSDMAAEWLRSQGFSAKNLAGGIDRWSQEVDPSIPRY
jgi:rhodanese-related sulfurtransferase